MRRILLKVLRAACVTLMPATAIAQSLPDCDTMSAAMLSATKAGRYEAAEQDFSPPMKQGLPPEALQALIEQQLASQLGRLQTIGEGSAQTVGAFTVISTPLGLERGALTATVSCDHDGKIAGFHLLPRRPATQPGAPYSLPAYADPKRYHEMPANVGSFSLGATFSIPNGAGPFPAIVLVPGSGPSDRDETFGPNKTFADLAAGLASRGIAVLRYDKRTYARPQEAAKADFNLDDEVTDDAVAAVALLRRTPSIDPKRIDVLGHSLGGLMAPRIALHEPAVAGLVLMAAPAAPFEDGYLRQRRYLADLDGTRSETEKKMLAEAEASIVQLHHLLHGEPLTGPLPYADRGIRAPYLLDWARLDAVADARKAAKPMLILQGDHDYQVSPQTDFGRWQAAFDNNPNVRLILYPGLSHQFRPAGDPPSPADYQKPAPVDAKVVNDIADWIGSTRISPAAAANN